MAKKKNDPETTYVVEVCAVFRGNSLSAPGIERKFANEEEARGFFWHCVWELPRDYAIEKETAGRLFDRRYRLVAELYAVNERSMSDDVLEHEEYAYADYLKDKENNEENED